MVSYTEHPDYREDSDQHDFDDPDTSTPDVQSIQVTPADFADNDEDLISPDNNFGLVLYDLNIEKTVKTVRTDGEFVDTTATGTNSPALSFSNVAVEYELVIENV